MGRNCTALIAIFYLPRISPIRYPHGIFCQVRLASQKCQLYWQYTLFFAAFLRSCFLYIFWKSMYIVWMFVFLFYLFLPFVALVLRLSQKMSNFSNWVRRYFRIYDSVLLLFCLLIVKKINTSENYMYQFICN